MLRQVGSRRKKLFTECGLISIHVLADALSFEWRLCDLAKTALVVLALLSEHLKLLLQIFQCLLDRLLALVSLLISRLERS